MPKLIVSTLLPVLLAACGLPAERPSRPPTQPIATETACLQHGGAWKQLGRLPVKRCLLPSADAGKACSDSKQCEGLCVAPEGSADGARVAGTCSVDNNPFGCTQRLEDGKAVTLCVD